jgi:hypothetical protein
VTAEQWKKIRRANTQLKIAQAADETVITLETSPPVMPTAWVNYVKQRLHLLGVDYKHIGAGRIVVTSPPPVADSVVRLVVSAIETANDYVKSVLRNRGAQRVRKDIAPAEAVQRPGEVATSAEIGAGERR